MSEISELKEILTGFIKEQKVFNEEQRAFNEKIDKKVDKVQYFLEETIAEHTKMFFQEQIEMKSDMKEMGEEIISLKDQLNDLSSRINLLFKVS